MTLAELQALTRIYDEKFWLEADGYTRILHRVLLDQGIEHTVWLGEFTYQEHLCPFHMWIQTTAEEGEVVVDFRLRNWFKIAHITLPDPQLQEIPHGVFLASQSVVAYRGIQTHIDLLDNRVIEALLDPPLHPSLLWLNPPYHDGRMN